VVLAFALVLLTGFFSMFFFAPMLAYIPEVVAKPEQVGAATGMNTLLGFVGSMVAPWLFGLLLDAGNGSRNAYLWGFVMLAAFGVASTVGMLLFGASRKRTA
jgi:MFS family permease